MPDRDENLDTQMEHDAEIRRETDIRDSLGPSDDQKPAADSALSEEERFGVSRADTPDSHEK